MRFDIFDNPASTPVQFIDNFPGSIELYLKREDLIHPTVQGNKWRKLKYNFKEALKLGYQQILTFGGAYSNHLYATASAGQACGVKTFGVIRGEIVQPLNATLAQATNWGMTLVPMNRTEYKLKTHPDVISTLKERWGDFYWIPEGGTNQLAIKGCMEIISFKETFQFCCVSCGTGGTLAGLISALPVQTHVLGFPALKGAVFLEKDIARLVMDHNISRASWELIYDYHFGGYAKITGELFEFIKQFKKHYKIILDPIYTAKMMYGIFDLLEKGFFPSGSKILAIHTGGLQGIAGIEEKYGKKII